MEKEPFVRYKTDEEVESEEGETFTLRLNPKERLWLDKLKKVLDIKSDGKALKIGAFVGLNVLHSHFGEGVLRYLFKKDRSRLSDYTDIEK